jgi:Spy/CpxP family protein refolding chaperone
MKLFRLIGSTARSMLLTAAVAGVVTAAGAQGRDHGGPPGGGGMGRGASMSRDPRIPGPVQSEGQGGLQLAPAGRWWDDKNFARSIGLQAEQQHRMDDVFAANRDMLVRAQKSLQHEESVLEKLSRSKALDENQIFQQIDRVTMARGELEKAYAHMLLQIRREMTPDQTAKLDQLLSQPQ